MWPDVFGLTMFFDQSGCQECFANLFPVSRVFLKNEFNGRRWRLNRAAARRVAFSFAADRKNSFRAACLFCGSLPKGSARTWLPVLPDVSPVWGRSLRNVSYNFPSLTSFSTSSPNRVLAHANQWRVKFFGSSL